MTATAARRELECFGGRVFIEVIAPDPGPAADAAAALARDIHSALTRFEDDSELSRLNRDPRRRVPSSDLLRRFAAAVRAAGEASDGLVDGTCLDALEGAGYRTTLGLDHEPPPLRAGHADTRPALTDVVRRWAEVGVDDSAGTVVRPPGVRLDSGGLGKGLAADLIAELLSGADSFAVDCSGDLRVGGALAVPRRILVGSPDRGGEPISHFDLTSGAAATSGIRRRSWVGPDGRVAHHLIDPGRGTPANTGVVQATALADTALEAEVRAKAALLSGPEFGPRRLVEGGLLVLSSGAIVRVPAQADHVCEVAA